MPSKRVGIELAGPKEIAVLLGFKDADATQVHQLALRADFPLPVLVLAGSGRVWAVEDVVEWAAALEGRRARTTDVRAYRKFVAERESAAGGVAK